MTMPAAISADDIRASVRDRAAAGAWRDGAPLTDPRYALLDERFADSVRLSVDAHGRCEFARDVPGRVRELIVSAWALIPDFQRVRVFAAVPELEWAQYQDGPVAVLALLEQRYGASVTAAVSPAAS